MCLPCLTCASMCSGEVRLLLQVKADLQKELDTLREGESRRMEQEEALR